MPIHANGLGAEADARKADDRLARAPRAAGGRALRAALSGGAAMALVLPALAHAEGEVPPAPEQNLGNEIVVTATKREQTLQDVPVAVTVTTAQTLERAQIRDIEDLQTVVPSLKVDTHSKAAETNFFIRGFGNGANNAGIEPSVGVFIDGVYRSRSAAQIQDFDDVERVEVLRGPQSTLFGKNASAGVVSITTQAPKFTLGGSAEATYESYNGYALKAMVTGPVSQDLALSISAGIHNRGGYYHDAITGASVDNRNRWFVRGQALWKPLPNLTSRLIVDYDHLNEICCAVVNLLPSGPTQVIQLIGGQVNAPSAAFGNTVYDNFNAINRIRNWGVSDQTDYDLDKFKLTAIAALRDNHTVTNQDADFTSADLLGAYAQQLTERTGTIELRLASKFKGPVNFLIGGFYFDDKIAENDQLYYGTQFRSYASNLIRAKTGGAFNVGSGNPAQDLELIFGGLDALAGSGGPLQYAGKFFATGQGQFQTFTLNDKSISVFGQVDVKPFERLTLTGGLNYTRDIKHFTGSINDTDVFSTIDVNSPNYAPLRYAILLNATGSASYAAAHMNDPNPAVNPLNGLKALQFMPQFVPVPNAVEPGRTSDGNVSWTARASFDMTRHLNLYLNFATGFKASSINLSRDSRPFPSDAAAIIAAHLNPVNLTYSGRYAGPETATLYEGGFKGNWRQGSLNVAVFEEEIKGFQSNVFTGLGFVLTNAGQQSVFGVEAEGNLKITPELTLNAGITYLDPKYDSFPLSSVGDLSGTKPADIPPVTLDLSGQYDWHLHSGDRVVTRVGWHYESPFQLIEGLPGFLSVGGTQAAVAAAQQFRSRASQIDASITWGGRGGVEVSLWGRNLNNERHIIMVFDSPAQAGSVSGYPNEPRIVGGTVRYKW